MEFCPGCGKKSKVVCKDCRPPKELNIKEIEIEVCSSCNNYLFHNKWSKFNEQAIISVAKQNIKQDCTITLKEEEIKIKPGLEQEIFLDVQVDDDNFVVPSRILGTYCPRCSKNQGSYFEGVLQLRKIDDAIFEFVNQFIQENRI